MARRPRGKLRVFVDASILIRGLTLPRFPYEVLQAGALGQVRWVTYVITRARACHYIETRFLTHLERFELFLAQDILDSLGEHKKREIPIP